MRMILLRRANALLLGAALGWSVLELGLWAAGGWIRLRDAAGAHRGAGAGLHVLCLGACYTLGVGVEAADAWPAQLEAMMNGRQPASPVRVTNGGVRSKGVDYFADRIEEELAGDPPDLLVLNVNDRILYSAAQAGEASSMPVPVRVLLGESRVYRLLRLLSGPPERLALPATNAAWRPGAVLEARALSDRGMYADAIATLGESGGGADTERFRLRLAVLAGRYDLAAAALAGLRAAGNEERGRLQAAAELGRLRAAAPAERISVAMDVMDAYAQIGEWGVGEAIADEVILDAPGAAETYDYRAFFQAMRAGGGAPSPDVEAFFRKSGRSDAATLGIYARDAGGAAADAEVLWHVLEADLGKIVRAARERGVQVVVEDVSSMPEQRPILAGVARALDVPYIHVQDALADRPDRAALMHPRQHLRLSVEGNRAVASIVLQGLVDEGFVR